MANKRIIVENKEIMLSDSDFLTDGGEASIYVKDGYAYKILKDNSRIIPEEKIKELSVLSDSRIIKPENMIYSGRRAIGYSMRFVKGANPVCRIFTRAFKDRNGITEDTIGKLVLAMREVMLHVHKHGILIVDFNEMNTLINKSFKDVFFIDVDSWQTKNHYATAIMESIRDRNSKRGVFNEGTDWFSFAVITFQMFMGIHPYKGGHKKVKTLEERMEQNISVFDKNVSLPSCCPSLDSLPESYLQWYKSVFVSKGRNDPPCDLVPVVVIQPVISKSQGAFIMKKLFDFKHGVDSIVVGSGGINNLCVTSSNGVLINKTDYIETNRPLFISCYDDKYIGCWIENENIKIITLPDKKEVTHSEMAVDSIMSCNDRLYAKCDDTIVEMNFYGKNPVVMVPTIVANVMKQATTLYPGVVIQDMLGSNYASVPKQGSVLQGRIIETDGYRIVSAKCNSNVLMIIGRKKSGIERGRYDRFLYIIDEKSNVLKYISITKDVSPSEPNFAVNGKGICAFIDDHDILTLFNVLDPLNSKSINDPAIDSSVRLFSGGGFVFGFYNGSVYQITSKK